MNAGWSAVVWRILPTLAVAAAVFGLAFDSGAYPLTTRNPIAIGVWWTIALTVGLALLPLARPTRAALVTGGLLCAFAGWTILSMAWTDSAELAFSEFNRVALYVGVFALAVLAGTRANVRNITDGMAIGIVAIALVALASRLFPDLVDERQLFQFLPGGENRLSYPLDYWNGLGIFVGLGFPLLLGIATEQRPALVRGLAVLPIPAMVATIYLTSSRGAAVTAVVGTVVFLALTARRLNALGATLCAATGSAAVVAVLLARDVLVDGPLASAAAANQGESAALLIFLACLATGAAVALASRFGPRVELRLPSAVRVGLGVALAAFVIGGVVALDPADRFDSFKKRPDEFQQAQTDFTRAHLLSESGSGRWQFWEAAVDEWKTRHFEGRGAGSFEAWWAQEGTLFRFIRDAHSLYLETLGELGLIGLALLMAALASALVAVAMRLFGMRAGGTAAPARDRVMLASLTALLVAWLVAAGIDWMWELTAVTVVAVACLGLLTGPATAGAGRPVFVRSAARDGGGRMSVSSLPGPARYFLLRGWVLVLAVIVIFFQGVPLLAQTRIRESQTAAERGNAAEALEKAREARDIQEWAASPHLQLALVHEQRGELRAAGAAIIEALDNHRSDWRLWLVRARIETKLGISDVAARSLREAERLNPRSPLFATGKGG